MEKKSNLTSYLYFKIFNINIYFRKAIEKSSINENILKIIYLN